MCNCHSHNLWHIENCISLKMKVMLISNLILNTLDYCNAVLARATAKDSKPLQNHAVCFAFRLKQREYITSYLKQLHFLPVKYRIMFKLCLKIKLCHLCSICVCSACKNSSYCPYLFSLSVVCCSWLSLFFLAVSVFFVFCYYVAISDYYVTISDYCLNALVESWGAKT